MSLVIRNVQTELKVNRNKNMRDLSLLYAVTGGGGVGWGRRGGGGVHVKGLLFYINYSFLVFQCNLGANLREREKHMFVPLFACLLSWLWLKLYLCICIFVFVYLHVRHLGTKNIQSYRARIWKTGGGRAKWFSPYSKSCHQRADKRERTIYWQMAKWVQPLA